MINRTLKPSEGGFSEREIKRAKKKLKRAGVPKEMWFIDTSVGPSNIYFMYMCAPELYTTIRYHL